MISLVLLIAAIACAGFAALADAGHFDLLTYGQWLALSLFFGWASFLPWWPARRP
jgi:hypothetical protein